jgi:5-methylcytosine-specific restriction endonuclease McrA
MPNAPQTHRQAARAKRAKRIDRRLPSSQRGYDQHWTRLRASYAKRFPLCQATLAIEGRPVDLEEVDHIIPIAGKTDPLRLTEANLQGLTAMYHRRKTRFDDEIRAEYDRLCASVGHDRAVDVVTGRWRASGNARGYGSKSSNNHL